MIPLSCQPPSSTIALSDNNQYGCCKSQRKLSQSVANFRNPVDKLRTSEDEAQKFIGCQDLTNVRCSPEKQTQGPIRIFEDAVLSQAGLALALPPLLPTLGGPTKVSIPPSVTPLFYQDRFSNVSQNVEVQKQTFNTAQQMKTEPSKSERQMSDGRWGQKRRRVWCWASYLDKNANFSLSRKDHTETMG
ncbi:hypothetical protein N431DRAFT_451569 [Stipitochalara longipes BDJ]|nr:hypothetical protein N431DRAFT_451569 [Stipitochalara longipes BDJ]